MIYEYHHIEPYEAVQRHEEHNLTLLCPNCHAEATSGLLPQAEVSRLDSARVAADVSTIPKTLSPFGPKFFVRLGNNVVLPHDPSIDLVAIAIDATPLVWFTQSDGMVFLNIQLYDETNELLVRVVENELIYRVDAMWDIESAGKTLTFRSAPRQVFLELQWEPPTSIAITRGLVLLNGIAFAISAKGTLCINTGMQLSNTRVAAMCGINAGRPLLLPSAIGTSAPINRYTGIDLDKQPRTIEWPA